MDQCFEKHKLSKATQEKIDIRSISMSSRGIESLIKTSSKWKYPGKIASPANFMNSLKKESQFL